MPTIIEGGGNLNKKAFEGSVLKGSNERAWSFLVCECHMGFEDDGRWWTKDQRSTVAEGARVPWRRGTRLPEYLLIYIIPKCHK